jgi:hypothetical protein
MRWIRKKGNVQKKLNELVNTKYIQEWAKRYLLQLIKANALCTIHSEPTEEPGAGFSSCRGHGKGAR